MRNVNSAVMPDGQRYRISSTKRYIVVHVDGYRDRWVALYRTNDEGRALARWRQEGRNRPALAFHVVDASTGQVIR